MTAFTAHNVVLPGGAETLPGVLPTADTGICQAALRDLAVVFRGWADDPPTVADLGCLEGGYAAAFARAGYNVTGYEANPDNYACCQQVQEALGMANLAFQQMDVRDLATSYDAVFCCGLLYHLDQPAAFLAQLGKLTRRVLIIQTHYSLHAETENENLPGSWYYEQPGRWSSHRNPRSFWLTRPALLQAIGDAGFRCVFEQEDYRDGGEYRDMFGTVEPAGRGMFVGIRP